MLSSIVELLERHKGALSVLEISQALRIESSALHPMLELLERKGRILKVELPCKDHCSGGCTCSDSMVFYKVKRDD